MTHPHRSAPRGARVLLLAQLSKTLTLALGLVVLSRLLGPDDFGIVAVAIAIIGAGETLRDMGLSAASITNPSLTSGQRNLLFWLNLSIGAVLALVVSAVSVPLGMLFTDGQLHEVLPLLSIVFLVNGFSTQYRAGLNREMKFAGLAVTDSIAPIVGVVSAIGLALVGAGFWSLVGQQLITSISSAVLLVALGRWAPGKPVWDSESRRMIGFGASVSWSQLLNYVGNNVDVFALGYWSSPTQLGFYSRAYQMTMQPLGLIKAPATSVALPLLSRRRQEPSRLAAATLLGQRLITYTVIPLALLLASTADFVVPIVLGEQWRPVASLVTMLAIAGALQQFVSVGGWLFLAGNHGRDLRRYSLVSLLVKCAIIVPAAQFGPAAVAAGYLVSVIVVSPIALVWACRVSRIRVLPLMTLGARPLIASVTAGLLAYVVSHAADFGSWPSLLSGIAVYAGTAALFCLVPAFRNDVWAVARTLFSRNRPEPDVDGT